MHSGMGRGGAAMDNVNGGRPTLSDRLGSARQAARDGYVSNSNMERDANMEDDQSGSGPQGQRKRFVPYSRGGGRGGFRGGHAGGSGGPPPLPQTGTPEVAITGYEGGTEESLLEFLKRKVDNPINIGGVRYEGALMVLTLQSWPQALTVRKLSGIRFAGGKLLIQLPNDGQGGQGGGGGPASTANPNAPKMSAIEVLTQLLGTRYDAMNKFLNLEAMDMDPIVRNSGLDGISKDQESSKMGPVICKLIAEKCPDVQTISLARNRLRTTFPFATLWERLPNLVNLSLQDNMLSSYRELEPINGKEFKFLRELVLVGNPLQQQQCSKPGGELRYRSDIKKLFPSIQVLDSQKVLEEISFDIGESSVNRVELPLEVKQGFFDNDVTSGTAGSFLQRFFQLFDDSRSALLDLYDPTSIFTLHINPNPPPHRSQTRRREDFEAWWNHNRNHSRFTHGAKRESLIYIGNQDIIRVFANLPQTRHPLNNPEKFVVDAWQTTDYYVGEVAEKKPMLFINVHGEFTEVNNNNLRSFSRTILLAPAEPHSKAALAGYPFTIVHDLLLVRPWSGNRAWTPRPTKGGKGANEMETNAFPVAGGAPGAAGMSPAVQQLRMQHGISDPQHGQVLHFSSATRLNYQFALQCLVEHGWDSNRALEGFSRVKQHVPPEAYVPM